MNGSLLYQAYGVQGYSYASTEYEGNAIFLHLKTIVADSSLDSLALAWLYRDSLSDWRAGIIIIGLVAIVLFSIVMVYTLD